VVDVKRRQRVLEAPAVATDAPDGPLWALPEAWWRNHEPPAVYVEADWWDPSPLPEWAGHPPSYWEGGPADVAGWAVSFRRMCARMAWQRAHGVWQVWEPVRRGVCTPDCRWYGRSHGTHG
jgi:hypothetical protein